MDLQHLLPLFLLIGSVFLAHPSFAKTIHVPADAGSVKEAVEMAVSGDEVVLDATEVDWVPRDPESQPPYSEYMLSGGIQIKGKTISILGGNQKERTRIHGGSIFDITDTNLHPQSYPLWMEDSHLTLNNLYISGLTRRHPRIYYEISSAPFHLASGSMIISDCTVSGLFEICGSLSINNSFVGMSKYSQGWPLGTFLYEGPGLHIHSANNINVNITNSTIKGGNLISFENVENSHIVIQNSWIEGNIRNTYFPPPGNRIMTQFGVDCIVIKNCTNLTFDMSASTVKGGEGWGGYENREDPIGVKGGDAIQVGNSKITINDEPAKSPKKVQVFSHYVLNKLAFQV